VVRTADLLLITNDTTPPVIASVTVTQRTNTSARINWTTDESSTSIVDYGTNAAFASVTNGAMVTVHSVLLTNLTPATTYLYRVRSQDSRSNLATSSAFSFTTEQTLMPPTITAHPQSQTVRTGSNVGFNVTASGTAPLAYQWILNGSTLTNATNSTLTRASVTSADAGIYSVVVSNAQGSAVSSNATLTVTAPSVPRVEGIVLLPDGRVELLVSSDAGYPVELQGSPDLASWTVVTQVINTNGLTTLTDNPSENRRYYRLRAE
jgi:hypothetical protein